MTPPPPPRPDILRPTEIMDLSDLFGDSPRPARLLVTAIGLLVILSVAHVTGRLPAEAEGGPVATAAAEARR